MNDGVTIVKDDKYYLQNINSRNQEDLSMTKTLENLQETHTKNQNSNHELLGFDNKSVTDHVS